MRLIPRHLLARNSKHERREMQEFGRGSRPQSVSKIEYLIARIASPITRNLKGSQRDYRAWKKPPASLSRHGDKTGSKLVPMDVL